MIESEVETIEEIKQLHLGIMTNKELAEWFVIKEKSFRDTRAKKLEQLKEYAEFENMRGKVNITKIINPIYTKGSKNFKLIKEKTKEQWSKTGLDTCKLVSDKIKEKYGGELTVSDTTLYTYTCTSKRELWGKCFVSKGELGRCKYELCKQINNECIPFTAEETEIKNKLLKKYFGDTEEKTLFIADMIDNGEITEEEAWKVFAEIVKIDRNWLEFKAELEEAINCIVVRATRIENFAF